MDENIKWRGPEFFNKQKTNDWYFAIGIIALALVTTSILLNNFLLAGIILIGTIVIVMYSKKTPPEKDFLIDKEGVQIDKEKYIYENLKSFWIKDGDSDFFKLLIKSNALLNSIIIIPLPKDYLDKTKNLLSKRLQEEPEIESVIEVLLEKLGF